MRAAVTTSYRWVLGFLLVLEGWPREGIAQPAVASEATAADQTISLDLKGVDILDVLKLLSQKSQLNFVAGRNVTGRVTIFAKDVAVWEAFERIVEANGLAYERQGGVVNLMTDRDYELLYGEKFREPKRHAVIALKYAKASQLGAVLNQLKSNVGRVVIDETSNTIILDDVPTRLEEMQQVLTQLDRPTETRIYNLNYADAEKLKEKVQEFLTPGLGTFGFDARTNKVVVTDLTETVRKIDQVIQAFDEQEGEVLIEAKIVKVELSDEQSLGIDWQQVFSGVDTQARGNFRVLSDIVGGTATGAALKFLSAPSGNTQIVLEALKKYGRTETISNPRIMVSNNQEAKILVGSKEAFVTVTTTIPATGSVVTSPQIQFVDVGTKLFVTPSIKRNGKIQLKIRPEVSTAKIETFQSNRIPILTTTEAETNVLVKSGTMLVIGGLIDTKNEGTTNQLPLLGDIPLLGAAFRSKVYSNKKTELVLFLTPQIISSSGQQVRDFPTSTVQRVTMKPLLEDPVSLAYQVEVRTAFEKLLTQRFASQALGPGSVEVSVVLGRDGRVVQRPQVVSADGPVFVEAAATAIEQAILPPFPKDATADVVRFHLTVQYRPESAPRPSS